MLGESETFIIDCVSCTQVKETQNLLELILVEPTQPVLPYKDKGK